MSQVSNAVVDLGTIRQAQVGKVLVAKYRLPFLERVYVLAENSNPVSRFFLQFLEAVGLYSSSSENITAFTERNLRTLSSNSEEARRLLGILQDAIGVRERMDEEREEFHDAMSVIADSMHNTPLMLEDYHAELVRQVEGLERENESLLQELSVLRRQAPAAVTVEQHETMKARLHEALHERIRLARENAVLRERLSSNDIAKIDV